MTVLCFLFLIASYANGQSDTKSSLTFVIDVTRSMESVRSQVEAHAHGIFDAVVRSNESDIENFVLVTFADPAALKTSVNNVTSTKDRDEFKDALSLTLVSGSDCPEYSMSGIKTGIENSKPGSTVYVFTDASAKDYKTYDHVKDLALEKEIRIVFILTGSCSKIYKKGYEVYTLLANDTSGQVFNLHKHNVSDILKWIKYSMVSRRILLKAKSFSLGDVLLLNYTTDLATRDTSISVSGCNKSLSVTGPDGEKLQVQDLVHLKNILVVKVNETKPGTHSVAFDCKTNTRLVVTAKSDIQFRHGFSGFVPNNLNDTTVKPSPDEKTHLSIKISGNFRPQTVNFVDAYDNVIPGYKLPLKPLNVTEELYVTGPFDTPFSMFRIIVTGLDLDHNATISRIGYTFVEPQNPYLDKIINKKPNVVIESSPKILIEIGSFLQLKCTVNAFPKPNITWEKDGTILETNVYDYDLPYAYVSVHKMVNVYENSTFICKANNSEGEDKQTLLVEMKPKPVFEVVEKPENVTIKYNDLVRLKCKVDAYPYANVTWYKNGGSLSKEDGITDDGSELVIQHMKLVNEGKYSCNVKNELAEEVIHFEIKISGIDKPKIVNTSHSLNFKEGTANTIACKIEKGIPEPNIHWYFNNGLSKYDEIVEAIDDEHLIMSKVNRTQAGKYKCVAINELGSDMMETNVIVEYPPIIVNDTNIVSANAGDEVVLSCSGDGVPEPNITWTKDGKPLAGSKFISTSDHRLIFEADMVDIGVYKCKASNKLGSSEKTVLLKVNKAPTSVILEGSSIDTEYDKPLTITCKIIAFPKPDILWVDKNGKTELKYVIEEKSLYHFDSYLDIDRLTTNATYQCKTNNSLGSDEAEITVIMAKKPYFYIFENPEDKNYYIKYNDTAQFFCKVDAYPPLEVNWYKDGGVLAKDDLSVSSNGSVLTIAHMQLIDQGTYKCEANNSITRFSFPFKITISGLEKPKIHLAPTNMNVTEKTNTTIRCRIDAGIPKPSIQWFYKETSLGYVEIVNAKDSEYLPLTNIDRKDGGSYKCEANNTEGTDWMETSVIVEYMPTIDNDTEPIIAKPGEEITLSCKADGFPKPFVQWTKDDMPLIGSKFTILSDHRLTFDVSLNDAGVYKCDASNRHGSKSKTINVEVHNTPKLRIKEKDKIDANIDEPLNITCEVMGFPKPDITWINMTDKSVLKSIIEEITPYHFVIRLSVNVSLNTTFQCKANNSLGASEDEIDILVKPFFKDLQCPEDKTHDIDFNKTASFVCKANAYPPAQVIWYKNGKVFPKKDLSVSSDGLTLTIKHMQPVDQGRYKCEVKNTITSSECTFAIRMSGVVKPKIIASLKTMNIVENSSAIIHCRIEKGTPEPTIRWYHKDIEIRGAEDREDLSFTNIKRGERGNYKCIATNLAGNDTMETDIVVEYAPTMMEDDNQTLSFLVDSKVILKCLADGVPKPTITWSKDDSPLNSLKFIKNSDNSVEFDVSLDDAGVYKCDASNPHGFKSKSINVEVHNAPKIRIKEKDKIDADIDETLNITCEVIGFPKPDITWINMTGKSVLKSIIEEITPYHFVSRLTVIKVSLNTTFQCKANNSLGASEDEIDILVKPFFKDLQCPEDKTHDIDFNKTASFVCNAKAYPPAQVIWYKNEKVFPKKDLSVSSDGLTLTIKHMQPVDQGRYKCEVKNTITSSECTFAIRMSGVVKPKIIASLKTMNIVENSSAIIHCRIEKGTPEPTIRWYHKDIEIRGAEDREDLSFTNIKRGEQGNYKCIATNLAGNDTMETDIVVEYAPTMMEDDNQTLSFLVDSKVILKCLADGVPKPTITWSKDDSPLNSLKFIKNSDNSVEFDVSLDDAGVYKCDASNPHGSKSKSINVEVHNAPKIRIKEKDKIDADIDETLNITCEVIGFPKPDITWINMTGKSVLKSIIEEITPYHFVSRLTVIKVSLNTTFQCKANNSLGASEDEIDILVKPFFKDLQCPEDKTHDIDFNKTASFVCNAKAYPPAQVIWYKNEKVFPKKDLSVSSDGLTLTIKHMQPVDQGRYKCEVKNTITSSECTFAIRMSGVVKPKIIASLKTMNIVENSSAIIHCRIEKGIPKPTIKWYHKDIEIVEAKGHEDLSFTIIKRRDQGNYKCIATNLAGNDTMETDIIVEYAPTMMEDDSQTSFLVDSKVLLKCLADGVPKPAITWTKDDDSPLNSLKFVTNSDNSLEFDVGLDDRGTYKCMAANYLGTAIKSVVLEVDTPPTVVIEGDPKQTVGYDGFLQLTCYVHAHPAPEIRWTDTTSLTALFAPLFLWNQSQRKTLNITKPSVVIIANPPYMGDHPPTTDDIVAVAGRGGSGPLFVASYGGGLCQAVDVYWLMMTFAIKPPYRYASILNITRAVKNTTYQCGAENIHGDHKSSVIVEVGTKTYFNIIDEPRDTVIPYHTQGHLYCNIDAYPPAKITWYKDLKEITNKKGLTVTDGILTFKNMEPFQRGIYTCEAKNSKITKTFVAKVGVSGLESPKISRTSSEKRNYIREVLVRAVNITLSCNVDKGIPKPSIKWMYKNKHTLKYVEIKDARDLETYSVTVSGDTLQYACEVSNLLGFDSLKMNLKLPVNHVIKKTGKKKRTLVAGEPNKLELECKVQKTKNLPRPKIKWIYNGTKDNPKDELLISEDSTNIRYHRSMFKSYNVTYDQRGLYTCIATNCFGIQSSDTFIVDVNIRPKILNRVKIIRAVVNDTALGIHCVATGHPKPTIRWTHEGNIVGVSETLTLHNITTRHGDFYNRTASFDCEAINTAGVDYAKFKVIIDDYPSLDNSNSTLKLELGKDVLLVCPIPHRDGDLIRWYKNNKKLTDGELNIYKAKVSDAGLYTCRVSNATDSRSANVDLKFGRRLVFTNTDVRSKISLGVGKVVALDCSAMGIPNPRVSWFHNGKTISATALYYRFKMNNAKSGIYKCEVTNDIDTISRTFHVVLNECLLKIDPNDRRQPLILTQRFTSPTYKYEHGYLYMPQNQSIILTCGTNGTFNFFTYDYINAFCNSAAELEIEGDYQFTDLKCNKEVTPYVKWTGKACQGEDSEIIEIGYEIRTKTLPVYEVCMDIANDVPFYTKQSMRLPIAEVIPKVAWFEDRLNTNLEAMYDVDEQINAMSSKLGFWFHKVDRCVFTQRQLVDPQGVFPGVPQGATFTHLNVVPQWSSCSTKNWDDVESRVRNLLKSTDELTVWTGTADILSLKDSYSKAQEIFLSDPKSRASPSPVSTYLWKVVQNRAKNASLAIIQINVPDIKPSDVYSYLKCRDVCSRINWMNSPEWSKTRRGYMFCCTLDQFEYTFGYRGRDIFGKGMDNLLLRV